MVPIPSSQIRIIAESGFFDLEQLRGRCDANAGGVDVYGLDLAYGCSTQVRITAPRFSLNATEYLKTNKSSREDYNDICPICVDIDTWLQCVSLSTQGRQRRPGRWFYLGPFRDVSKRAPRCRLCRLLAHLVTLNFGTLDHSSFQSYVVRLDYFRGSNKGSNLPGSPYIPRLEIVLSRLATGRDLLQNRGDVARPRLSFQLQVLGHNAQDVSSKHDPADSGSVGGQPPNSHAKSGQISSSVDPSIIKFWLEECEHKHTSTCGSPVLPEAVGELRNLKLLDVYNLQVVDAPENPYYYALSYVWGGISPPEPTTCSTPGSTGIRDYSKAWNAIPKTIRDAVLLVKQLQGKYIWIDSLCINQTDSAEKMEQIVQMGSIYAKAALTIVAAAGRDANAGILGVYPGSRLQAPVGVTIGRTTLFTSLPDTSSPWAWAHIVKSSIWNQRGWTYQERILSTRRLIFTDYQAFFMCRGACFSEARVAAPEKGEDLLGLGVSPRIVRTMSLSAFSEFLREFSTRKLTIQSDVLNASLAALQILAHRLETDIIWGLPESIFPRAMLWTVQHNSERVTCGFERSHIPSWSWASWAGRTDFDKANNGMRSCVKWYTLTVSGTLRLVNHSRVQEFDLSCDQNRSERDRWEPISYAPPTSNFPPGLYSGSPAEGNSTGLLVGWAVTVSVMLTADILGRDAAHTTCLMCDALLYRSQEASLSISLKPFVVSRAWWDTRNAGAACQAILVGISGDQVEILLVDQNSLGLSKRIGAFTSKFEHLESAKDLRWELISLS